MGVVCWCCVVVVVDGDVCLGLVLYDLIVVFVCVCWSGFFYLFC